MKHQVAFISHGGGPMPLLGDPQHAQLMAALQALPQRLNTPKAIVVISAHWESSVVSITSSAQPGLLYDYHGFPPESYQLRYPSPGAPALAEQLAAVLRSQGHAAQLDNQRGLDHGVFVPLMLMYPQANIPVLQVSLSASLGAAEHIALGQALGALDAADVLFLGSGFSFHNMQGFFMDTPAMRQANQGFEDWLGETLTDPQRSPADIRQRLVDWRAAPGAEHCHPRAEHLMPLHVCFGIAGQAASARQQVEVLNKQVSNFVWTN
jgi:4,5-DOPA dioxygenase extradiol